ncbi:MAG: response regulator [Verrucomicrobiota bacterium]
MLDKPTILTVDDEKSSLQLITLVLQGFGYTVQTAENGEQAWSLFDENPYRIVISDWHMPQANGLELCRKVRERPKTPYTYFILLTALKDTPENYSKAIDTGVDDFLTKPLNRSMLWTRLHVAERILEYTSEITELQQLLPICSYCKQVRNPDDYWEQIESYFERKTGTLFSHGVCPECYEKYVLPEINALKEKLS